MNTHHTPTIIFVKVFSYCIILDMSWYVYGVMVAVILGTYNFLYGLLLRNMQPSTVLIGLGLGNTYLSGFIFTHQLNSGISNSRQRFINFGDVGFGPEHK